jgi:hypothetical protein
MSLLRKVRKYGNAIKISLFGVDSMLGYWNVWISSGKKPFYLYNLQLKQINYAI